MMMMVVFGFSACLLFILIELSTVSSLISEKYYLLCRILC